MGKWSYRLRRCGFVSQGSKRDEWANMEAGEEKRRPPERRLPGSGEGVTSS